MSQIKEEARELAKLIRAVVFDVDGVLTDNRVLEGASYNAKWRSYYDGQGVSLLRAIGIFVCFVTNEKGEWIQNVVKKWNDLPSSRKPENPNGWAHVTLFTGMGGDKKVVAAKSWLKEIGASFDECAAMGDDNEFN